MKDGEGPRSDSSLDDRAPGQSTQILQPAKSKGQESKSAQENNLSTAEQHKSILAMYSDDGNATGKISVSKMIQELQTANYGKEDITAVLNTMYEIQNVPEAQRLQLPMAEMERVNQTVAATPITSSQNTL